ncbi:hypothetical protein K501DRAFT_29899 [Backusella circina FSU 941]|nr:hypothetical protein K501DRAFT_29899 [Backusella circina FSU 941]
MQSDHLDSQAGGCVPWAVSRSFSRGGRFRLSKKNRSLLVFRSWGAVLLLLIVRRVFLLRHPPYCEIERV